MNLASFSKMYVVGGGGGCRLVQKKLKSNKTKTNSQNHKILNPWEWEEGVA